MSSPNQNRENLRDNSPEQEPQRTNGTEELSADTANQNLTLPTATQSTLNEVERLTGTDLSSVQSSATEAAQAVNRLSNASENQEKFSNPVMQFILDLVKFLGELFNEDDFSEASQLNRSHLESSNLNLESTELNQPVIENFQKKLADNTLPPISDIRLHPPANQILERIFAKVNISSVKDIQTHQYTNAELQRDIKELNQVMDAYYLQNGTTLAERKENEANQIMNYLYQTANQYNVNPILICQIINVESGFRPFIVNREYATGMSQFLAKYWNSNVRSLNGMLTPENRAAWQLETWGVSNNQNLQYQRAGAISRSIGMSNSQAQSILNNPSHPDHQRVTSAFSQGNTFNLMFNARMQIHELIRTIKTKQENLGIVNNNPIDKGAKSYLSHHEGEGGARDTAKAIMTYKGLTGNFASVSFENLVNAAHQLDQEISTPAGISRFISHCQSLGIDQKKIDRLVKKQGGHGDKHHIRYLLDLCYRVGKGTANANQNNT